MDLDDSTPLPHCEEALHESACEATGHSEFGPDEYREGLRVFLNSCESESNLTPVGRLLVKGQVLSGLTGRLLSEAGFSVQREVSAHTLERPLVIVGMPRTASTALHRMLSRDPDLQGLELWVAESPMPRPPREEWGDVPAFIDCDTRTRALYEASPEMRAIHEMDAHEVDECWHLLRQSFGSVTFECNFRVPTYSRWWAGRDMRAEYARYRKNLEMIGSNAPGCRWLLKDATHMFHMEAFLETFPDACVVTTRRDPLKIIPSVASLTSVGMQAAVADFDPHAHGRDQLALWRRGMGELEKMDERWPSDRLYQMNFDDFQADPMGEVLRIYERFGFSLSEEGRLAMQTWRMENQRGHQGTHVYSPEEFGLSALDIKRAFSL